ncbi:MAG: DinB family protein [Candidatus Eisenbacteria bacterium]
MIGKALQSLCQFGPFTVRKNIEGITQEESLRAPEGGGNHMNWVMGHIVATRSHLHRLLGKEPLWSEEEIALYDRGAPGGIGRGEAIDMGKMIDDFEKSQETFVAVLEGMSDEEFAGKGAPKGIGGESMGEQLAAFMFHEAYHAGQLGILRRGLGKPGGIT